MNPFSLVQQQTQKRSREDFASQHASDCYSSFAKSSDKSVPEKRGANASNNLGEISWNCFDEQIYSIQKKQKLNSNHSNALDQTNFATPIRSQMSSVHQASLNTMCPSPNDLQALEFQLYPQLNSFPPTRERNFDFRSSNSSIGIEALPTATFEPLSYLDRPFPVLHSKDRKKEIPVPPQSFATSQGAYQAGSFNSNAINQALSLKDIAPPEPLCPISSLNSSGSSGSRCGKKDSKRFKPFHEEKWNEHLDQLRAFKKKFGHCLVPHTFPENQHLARWVKRQRRQYKLMLTGNKCSTMTQERVDILNDEGFIWDSHDIVWRERYNQLVEYKAKHGHTRVPSYCQENPQLASWVKCQRRQYKLFWEGKRSSMSAERTELLESIGFTWEVKKQRSSSDYQKLAQVLSDLH
eukprot:CAMPEP_0204625150 /NCGR_PEP_ID=MMETSP0717-20131115/10898_1 /ASSEMBLY_ACC=CAM_ASM_000666 /TAXON_ID=230516 /ORGANISM="Chaetoceros curvisetus" /LENGTH=407 /DNA_ID=CAMNT_0051640773 /DNA_START=42 /DNA_END=1265 /DNA_ORIENTATION=+